MYRFAQILIALLSFSVAGYAAFVYGTLPLGLLLHPDMRSNYLLHQTGIYTHVFAAMTALALGPFQFWTGFRRKYRTLHRHLGRIYLGFGVLLGGLSGLYMAQFAFGGAVAQSGFAVLAALWLYTGVRAFLAVKHGDIQAHQSWMIRNFALTLGAVTFRLYLSAAMLANVPFEVAYPVIAWVCWLPNLLAAEWLVGAQKQHQARGRALA